MLLSSISLQNIRSHLGFSLENLGKSTLIIGDNGSGKSSILEAIHLLASGNSDRVEKISEMVTFGQELGRIQAEVISEVNEEKNQLEGVVTVGVVGGRRTPGRLWSLNGVRRQHSKISALLHSVLFRPEDMRLIEGSPSRRRHYLNSPLIQTDAEYAHSLKTYEQYLIRRNKLLIAVREKEQPANVLHYWTQGILKHGMYVQEKRASYLSQINSQILPMKFQAQYLPSLLNPNRLAEYADKEVLAGHTLIGPHKDDFDIDMSRISQVSTHPEFMSALRFGSRGQQRLAVLWLKMAELGYIAQSSGESPVLLLDDIFSELDENSQKIVLSILPDQQTFLTTVEEADAHLAKWQIVRL